MATGGPIKIAFVAQTAQAKKDIQQFASSVDSSAKTAGGALDETARRASRAGSDTADGFARAGDGADLAEQRAMGFRDTITGVQDSMSGMAQIARGDLAGGLLTLGMGIGDLASGFANLLIPLAKNAGAFLTSAGNAAKSTAAMVIHKGAQIAGAAATGVMTAAQWALNAAMSANPITLIIIAIVALVAAIVIAYKKSEKFRAVVQAVWNAIKTAVSTVINWVTGNIGKIWDKAKEIWDKVKNGAKIAIDGVIGFFKGMKDKVLGALAGGAKWLTGVGKDIIDGLLKGIQNGFDAVKRKLGELTDLLPDWKGPRDRDKKLLVDAGQLIMGGFRKGLESQYTDVRKSLSGFTDSLGGTADLRGDLSINTSANSKNREQTIKIELASSGNRMDDMLLEILRKSIRVRGGNAQVVLG